MSDNVVRISCRRFKGGTWAVYITYPDGSTESRRGLVDDGHVSDVLRETIRKVEREAAS